MMLEDVFIRNQVRGGLETEPECSKYSKIDYFYLCPSDSGGSEVLKNFHSLTALVAHLLGLHVHAYSKCYYILSAFIYCASYMFETTFTFPIS